MKKLCLLKKGTQKMELFYYSFAQIVYIFWNDN